MRSPSIWPGIVAGFMGCGVAVYAGYLGVCVLDIASWPVALPFLGLSAWATAEAIRCFWDAVDAVPGRPLDDRPVRSIVRGLRRATKRERWRR